LVIGNEILKGMTADTNTQAAAKALWEHNVPLAKVVVVSDDQDEIVEEILRLQHQVDVIITSGGVGPTHDDVTIKSVAAALGQEMVFDDEMAKLLIEKMNDGDGTTLSDAQLKMASLPANARLRYLSDNNEDWPFLQCRNIFILPGVPKFFCEKIETLATYLSTQLERSETYKVVLSVDEECIVRTLNNVVERHPNVTFGSYPFVDHPAVKTVVTLEGRLLRDVQSRRNSSLTMDPAALAEQRFSKDEMDYNVRVALDDLIDALPKGSILRVDDNRMLLS
jgi:FAD synthetase